MIDRIRHDIQQRLEQLLAEADKLRRALVALDPRERVTPTPRATRSKPTSNRAVKLPETAKRTSAHAGAPDGVTAARRTRPGVTRSTVLAALSPDGGLTAGEIAKATGLARPTVSTTLSRLAKTGAVVKADRGYRLPQTEAKP